MGDKILVVEDTADCRELLRFQLLRMGYRVIEAKDGLEGVEKGIAEVPDLIIMDLGLPRLTGIEATRRLSAHERTKHIPILIHTAWQGEGPAHAALEAGAAEVLTKPASYKVLQDTLKKLLVLNLESWPVYKIG
jgi:CheY-like chemotaxis protein